METVSAIALKQALVALYRKWEVEDKAKVGLSAV